MFIIYAKAIITKALQIAREVGLDISTRFMEI